MDDRSSLVEQIQLNQLTSLDSSKAAQLINQLGGIQGLVNLLRHNSSVTKLWLKIGDDEGMHIARLLHYNAHILEIYFNNNNNIGAEGAKALAGALKLNSALQTINLGCNRIGDEGANAIAEAIKVNSALQKIHLGRNSIGAEGAKAVAEAIKVNSTLQEINLDSNCIGAEGAKAVAEAIKVNSMLEKIHLGRNSIGDEGAKALAEAIKVNLHCRRLLS
jgi:Ran GTPase-activating protein (RanGAP) involved in mRNA processing and transport